MKNQKYRAAAKSGIVKANDLPGDLCNTAIGLNAGTPISVKHINSQVISSDSDQTNRTEYSSWFKFISDGSGKDVMIKFSELELIQKKISGNKRLLNTTTSLQISVVSPVSTPCSGNWNTIIAAISISESGNLMLPNAIATSYYLRVESINCSETGFTLAADNITRVPVEMMFFDAKLTDKNKVELSWSTASEFNNDHFKILRSKNEIDYEVIGRVAGKGNSDDVSTYQFISEKNTSGNVYFKLKYVDGSGNYSYTDPIVVKIGSMSVVQITSHPTVNVLSFKNDLKKIDTYEIAVVTPSGANALYSKIANHDLSTGLNVDISNLQRGMYHLRIVNSTGERYFARFIKE